MDFSKLFSRWNGKKQEIHFSENTPEFSDACVVIPLTSKEKKGSYYFHFLDHENISQYAILHQVRYIDAKRMKYKMGNIKQKDFQNLQNIFCSFIKNNPTSDCGEPQRGKLS